MNEQLCERNSRKLWFGCALTGVSLLVASCMPGSARSAEKPTPRVVAQPVEKPAPLPTIEQPNCHQALDLNTSGKGKINVVDPDGHMAQIAVQKYKSLVAFLFVPYTKETGPPEDIYALKDLEQNISAIDHTVWYRLDEKYGVHVGVKSIKGGPNQLVADCKITPRETTFFGEALK